MSSASRYSAMLEEIGNQEEFRLDTPVNREVLKVLEELKGTEEKKSVEELLLTIEGEVVELISTCISGSVELMKRKSIPKFHKFRTYRLPDILKKYPHLPANSIFWQICLLLLWKCLLELSQNNKENSMT